MEAALANEFWIEDGPADDGGDVEDLSLTIE